MISLSENIPHEVARNWPRFSNIKDLSLTYEGRSEVFPVHPPDISPTGMFINTAADFPEGAILKVRFRLAKSNHPIDVRCEVRYCLLAVGVGVEFIGLSQVDQQAIAKEIRTPGQTFKLKSRASTKKQSTPRPKKR